MFSNCVGFCHPRARLVLGLFSGGFGAAAVGEWKLVERIVGIAWGRSSARSTRFSNRLSRYLYQRPRPKALA